MRWLCGFVLVAIVSGCAVDGPTRPRALASGLSILELRHGRGTPAASGDLVAIHYTMWLEDGTKIDSSRERGQVFRFVLGRGQVIAGFDQGVNGMRVGGLRRLWIPPDLAYGTHGVSGIIPPNASLIAEVELVEFAHASTFVPAPETIPAARLPLRGR